MDFRTLHIIAGASRMRAELASIAFGLGYHAEVYADTEELAAVMPQSGIVLIEDAGPASTRSVFDACARQGTWLPVVAVGERPRAGRVVEAVKQGVLDYLALPVRAERLASCLGRIVREAAGHAAERMRRAEANAKLSALSPREQQVLDRMAEGMSNKLIARDLAISPRTVEIHRANMLTKLGVDHSAAAIRLQIEAEFDARAHSRVPRQAEMLAAIPSPGSIAEKRSAPMAGHAPVAQVVMVGT